MIIALTGTHSTGKTTLVEEMKEMSGMFYNYNFIQNITRGLRDRGFNINEDGNEATQLALFSEHLNYLYNGKNLIFDRSIIDVYAYTLYLCKHGNVGSYICDLAKSILINNIKKYDCIFYLPIEFEVVSDGVRSTNNEFREEVDSIIRSVFSLPQLKNKVFELSGGIGKRVEKISEIITNKGGNNGV